MEISSNINIEKSKNQRGNDLFRIGTINYRYFNALTF